MSASVDVSKVTKEKHRIRPLEIVVIQEAPLPGMTYLSGFGEVTTTNGYIWYIEGPKENIIVDTGGKAETIRMLGIPAKDVQSPENALGKLGLKCKDIGAVILTHLMSDHFEYAGKFENARFVVQKDELDYARNPHPLMQYFYLPIQDLLDEVNFDVVEGDREIVSGVKVLLTPGHSPGSQSVAIETEKGTAVITGFCCINENFVEGVWPVTPPGIHINATQAYDSMLKVKEIADIVIPLHESTFAKKDIIP
jgi:N-acyl homoserine lactone hydrolase